MKSNEFLTGETPSINDFDKKLTETDCYLQILLKQVSALKVKIDDPEISTEAKSKYEEIAENAIAMTEAIKHGIVLLQIAKNATLPEISTPKSPGLFYKITYIDFYIPICVSIFSFSASK